MTNAADALRGYPLREEGFDELPRIRVQPFLLAGDIFSEN
jgi:hypothetical protein